MTFGPNDPVWYLVGLAAPAGFGALVALTALIAAPAHLRAGRVRTGLAITVGGVGAGILIAAGPWVVLIGLLGGPVAFPLFVAAAGLGRVLTSALLHGAQAREAA